jgi:putative ABC transport system ATP-binding protein
VLELMFDLNRAAGTTLVVVTHDDALAERVDRRLLLRAGRLTDHV